MCQGDRGTRFCSFHHFSEESLSYVCCILYTKIYGEMRLIGGKIQGGEGI